MDINEVNASSLEYWQSGQVLLLNKPLGWTSFDLVKKVRYSLQHKFRIKKLKVGHAGTLDPLACGLMIICTGKATKMLEAMSGKDKEYIADIRLGSTTASFDLESPVDKTYPVDHIGRDDIIQALSGLTGPGKQVPPVFSAKRISGVRAYDHARRGDEIKLEARDIILYELDLLRWQSPDLRARILCSKGTYIRAFARDLGQYLGSGGHLIGLQRTRIGDYTLDQALDVEDFKKNLTET